MHRPLVLALILALAAAVAALWFFSRGDVPPPAGTNTTNATTIARSALP